MTGRSRAALFLIEKLIVIAVFALCAAACASIFVESFIMSNEAKDLNNALIVAKNGAERFKAYDDLEEVARSLGGDYLSAWDKSVVVFYDENWRVTMEHLAAYAMTLRPVDGEPSFIRLLTVETVDRKEILSFTVSARAGPE